MVWQKLFSEKIISLIKHYPVLIYLEFWNILDPTKIIFTRKGEKWLSSLWAEPFSFSISLLLHIILINTYKNTLILIYPISKYSPPSLSDILYDWSSSSSCLVRFITYNYHILPTSLFAHITKFKLQPNKGNEAEIFRHTKDIIIDLLILRYHKSLILLPLPYPMENYHKLLHQSNTWKMIHTKTSSTETLSMKTSSSTQNTPEKKKKSRAKFLPAEVEQPWRDESHHFRPNYF